MKLQTADIKRIHHMRCRNGVPATRLRKRFFAVYTGYRYEGREAASMGLALRDVDDGEK
jgi:hypothetical protein